MAQVAVLGATGKLGEILVNRALATGHRVSAFARDPTKLQQRYNESLALFRGDANNAADLEPAVAGCRCVISAFDPQTPEIATHVVKLLRAPPLARFVFMSRLGVGDSLEQAKNASGILAALRPRVQRQLYEGFSLAEGVVRTSGLPYVILRAAALNDEHPGQEVVTTEATDTPPSRVARADLAKFIMRVLEDPQWDRRELTVGSRRTP